jgi:predicted transcriptional regulator
VEVQNVGYDVRVTLLKHISENPGIRYRELFRLTNLANGVLTYHLSSLEKTNRVKVDRRSRVTRYYPLDVSSQESDVIGSLKPETARKIVMFILEHDLCTFNEIVERIGKAPSTVSWTLKRLKDSGIITARYGEYTVYRLADKKTVTEILSKYKESFMDRVVDNYVDMINEL